MLPSTSNESGHARVAEHRYHGDARGPAYLSCRMKPPRAAGCGRSQPKYTSVATSFPSRVLCISALRKRLFDDVASYTTHAVSPFSAPSMNLMSSMRSLFGQQREK